jgi:hypothetical protein
MTLIKEFHRVLEKEFQMTLIEEFHQNAEQCLRKAESAGDPRTRDVWERVAEKWLRREHQEAEDIDRVTSH